MIRSALTLLLAAPCAAQVVDAGLDVLVADGFAQLRGRKVGLITNHTGVDRAGRSIVDVFTEQGAFELVTLFSPEHGFLGVLDESNIANATHDASGLPIYSLYGETRQPTAEMLRGVDTLVFDIQDIGCRFYTYLSTLRLAMEAAAEHDLRVVVLDRPNPIGGVLVEGPVLDAGTESFVGYHTVAVRHGMTAGELANMMNAERDIGCELVVVPCHGWTREMLWDATGRLWIDPSPNMRTLNQAITYPGIGLLETTNLSVGRGTDTPFEILGAPWIEGVALAAALRAHALPGVTFVPVEFTPDASKFADQRCGGVQILITDRDAFRALPCGIAVATELRRLYPDDWSTERYGRLLCDEAVLAAVRDGRDADEIRALWRDELAEFERRRAGFLLYE